MGAAVQAEVGLLVGWGGPVGVGRDAAVNVFQSRGGGARARGGSRGKEVRRGEGRMKG